jgi:hypothetical protein
VIEPQALDIERIALPQYGGIEILENVAWRLGVDVSQVRPEIDLGTRLPSPPPITSNLHGSNLGSNTLKLHLKGLLNFTDPGLFARTMPARNGSSGPMKTLWPRMRYAILAAQIKSCKDRSQCR